MRYRDWGARDIAASSCELLRARTWSMVSALAPATPAVRAEALSGFSEGTSTGRFTPVSFRLMCSIPLSSRLQLHPRQPIQLPGGGAPHPGGLRREVIGQLHLDRRPLGIADCSDPLPEEALVAPKWARNGSPPATATRASANPLLK